MSAATDDSLTQAALAATLPAALALGVAIAPAMRTIAESAAVTDLVGLAQTAGAQLGGALNAVSQGEQDLMRRSAALALWLWRPV